MLNHPPKKLQATLWSTDTNNLDLEKDKNYIIHQTLSIGGIEDWRWLFKTYPSKTIISTFVKEPAKIYMPQRFSLAKVMLGLKNRQFIREYYVVNTPRIIRQKPA
ncbi:hypothetical protein A2767_06450 [Candidatus Roizmanbacteria bacterium RIFCSPHIGHO2_01_FULL_35_10]|uniref:DUF6922 domain-containing protein n=1 Tax=Candidatus Roizmanbacteria bacterium RIFCSPLOWO2_01_FULL_35_13 TaxID=1802055 RepID=A0A1F7I831_9BACT|nr:MAG: hypothetical protein A2767_06450 [Candidatus Roizmanbacteria bacterium RIFCSPHIGHO2_01_FULL_35_10]OGK39520.1 MAG: hypothetical protein A3A74_00690 [Candidatus Roizmanbacteria bacterium RIFCSPLOWO2_01_FULL_35_13]